MEYESDEEFPVGLACAMEAFREKDIVLSYIKELPDMYHDPAKVELSFEKYTKILDQYQEQPHLLDSSIPELIEACLESVRKLLSNTGMGQSISATPLEHLSLKYLRHVFKVRGYKDVIQAMPHEINDLAPVLGFLESIDLEDPNVWESATVLIYWLSILVVNPFELKLLDFQGTSGQAIPTSQRLLSICMKCITLNNNVGQAVPVLIGKLLTRKDMLQKDIPLGIDATVYDLVSFINWSCENMEDNKPFGNRRGAFLALASLFKQAKREQMVQHGSRVLVALLASNFTEGDTLIRKMGIKLTQRVGLLFLKTKVAPWRYTRGCRRLIENLQADAKKDSELPDMNQNIASAEDDELDYAEVNQFSDELESVLDKLLKMLDDKDTIVRWSAAKGIGRLVNRLPKDYGNEVVESVLRLLSPRESNGAWQGGCMALAELAKRGLLLPERLHATIPVLRQALLYDEVRGNFSVGSHVRDSACYGFWAFARAFEPDILRPFANEIAIALAITMVFDREVNCRRAAAAAFQENVGRQGSFPDGMGIITVADYFSVGNRKNAFTKVSVDIAKFSTYTRPLIDHLIEHKFNHFDTSIRQLTATTLGNMAELDPEYMLSSVMNELLPVTTESDLATSHGAILCLSSVMAQLSSVGMFKMEGNNQVDIRNIVLSIVHRQFRPTGSSHNRTGHELLRQALNYFIKCCAVAKLPFHNDRDILEAWYALLEENVSFYDPEVRISAADALPSFLHEYFYTQPDLSSKIGQFVTAFSENLNSNVMTTRIGYAHAIGKLPLHLLKDAFPSVIAGLIQCAQISSTYDANWAESRREATIAIANILSNKITKTATENWADGIPLNMLEFTRVWEQLIIGMNDYTTDKRGDIGSWVREASMTGIKSLIIGLRNYEILHEMSLMSPSQYTYLLALIAKQCVEKIDNVRVHAGKIFAAILHHSPAFEIAHRELLVDIFPKGTCATLNWRSSSVTFPKFTELLALPEYTSQVLCGFVISGGSLSDTVLRGALNAVQRYLDGSNQTEVRRIADVMIQIFKENQKVERVTLPLMKFWALLLRAGIFYDILSDNEKEHFGLDLVSYVKAEIFKTSKIDKIIAGADVLGEALQGTPEVVTSALKRLVVLLCHAYPRVRMVSSQRIFEALATYGETMDIGCDKQTEAIQLLRTTRWESPLEQLRETRNTLCTLLGVPLPVPLAKKEESASSTNVTT